MLKRFFYLSLFIFLLSSPAIGGDGGDEEGKSTQTSQEQANTEVEQVETIERTTGAGGGYQLNPVTDEKQEKVQESGAYQPDPLPVKKQKKAQEVKSNQFSPINNEQQEKAQESKGHHLNPVPVEKTELAPEARVYQQNSVTDKRKEKAQELGAYQLDPVTVVGTHTEIEESIYPGSANMLKTGDMLGGSTIIEELSTIPGFESGGGVGRSIGDQFTIRGFGYQSEERVIIKQDDIRRSATMFSNHISSFRTEQDILRKVEVVKGASSIIHGGGAIGGIVGMTTKDAYDFLLPGQNTGVQLKARYESNNHRSASAALYGTPFDGKYDFLLFFKKGYNGDIKMAKHDQGDSDFDEHFYSFFSKYGMKLTDDQKISLSFFNLYQDVDTVWQSIYHSTYPDDGPVKGIVSQKDAVLKYELAPADNKYVDLSASLFWSEGYYDRTADYKSRNILVDYKNEDVNYGLNIKNKARFSLGGTEQTLLVGADLVRREEDAVHAVNGELNDFGSLPNRYDDFGLYLQDEFFLFGEKLMLLLGGRYDHFERSVSSVDKKYSESRFSPRFGSAFQLFSGFHLLANYSESFRAPTPHETSSNGPLNPHYWYLPNPDLKPEIAKEYELGFSYVQQGLFGTDLGLFFKSVYFNGRIEDMIGFKEKPELGMSPEQSPYGSYANVEKAKRHGTESQLRLAFKGLSLDTSFEHLNQYHAKTKEKIPSAFADKLRVGLAYTFNSIGLTLKSNVSHWFRPDQNPEFRIFRGKKYYLVRDDFTICNVMARWVPKQTAPWLENTELAVGVNNVFDAQYINARNYEGSNRSGKGRNIFVSLTKKF